MRASTCTKSSSGSASVPPLGSLPPQPRTVMVRLASTSGSAATVMSMPSRRMQSVIASVSSLHSAPRSVTSPSPSAASTMARFVIDLLPGMTISDFVVRNASSCSAEKGATSMSAGSGIAEDGSTARDARRGLRAGGCKLRTPLRS
eukprot:scaffold53835_cov57-Phaeocystis_antarctica.AAC.3